MGLRRELGASEKSGKQTRLPRVLILLAALTLQVFSTARSLPADETLLKTHCTNCHKETDPAGDFSIQSLGPSPTAESVDHWETSLEYVKAREMPPADESRLSDQERQQLVAFLKEKIRVYNQTDSKPKRSKPRRLNNRELKNSLADVLMIEDVGTHQPTANLLGDTLEDGFDTNGEALGLSEFHLEQYIDAIRAILDATILEGEEPSAQRYDVKATDLRMTSLSQRIRRPWGEPNPNHLDFLDIRLRAYFSNFETVPTTGRYRIKVRATGIDRGIYDAEETGIYHADPIRLKVHLGDRVRIFDLPDREVREIELNEWLAAGTRIELSYPTDGLRMKGNGNFKFQYRIAHDYLKQHDQPRYQRVLKEIVPKAPARTAKSPSHWSHWTGEWQGPRPRLFDAEVEGPFFESWPPARHQVLLGENPNPGDAASILQPIAQRAWRRDVSEAELAPIVSLVQTQVDKIGTVEAFKDGIVAILVSPSFLLINPEEGEPADRFATKFSYFLKSTSPNEEILQAARNGKLDTLNEVLAAVQRHFDQGTADEFLKEFPQAWLQLDRINFMAPDPDHFPLYDRKRISEDMIAEVQHFFRYAIKNNLPVTELISADYSFLNADLAKVYDVEGVPQDSVFRKYTFHDNRRGGLLGMGAFLTLTADSLGTSPIHRAVYVMENFLGIHPSPPPGDVEISEPDVRQAKTIKEILAAHMSDTSCASCHKTIDPYGYAFENFGPMGEWRDEYTMQVDGQLSRQELQEIRLQNLERTEKRLPLIDVPGKNHPIPVDASARFRNGEEYQDILEYRKLMLTDVNRDRFVRCFITKLLTYANGETPTDYTEVENILSQSAQCDYRIVDTIAAVVDSPLFRDE